MYTLIAFATQWGSKLGGINSFNTDFLSAFGVAYHLGAKIICIVATATDQEIQEAFNTHVRLVPLPNSAHEKRLTQVHAQAAIAELKRLNVDFNAARTVWLGHDLISGVAANEAAKIAGGRSAVIHHMSYDHYESFAENSDAAYKKTQQQVSIFQQADLVLAIGPLLRDALYDRLGGSKDVVMLIPGLAEINIRPAPKTFTAFLSGRLSENAAKVKQGHLGIAAFARAQYEARQAGMPDALWKKPKLILRGVELESKQLIDFSPHGSVETELMKFAEVYAHAVINLHALPYTLDRQLLYNDLSSASVALMPSWHEGFGLVAWEAIAAGVPLIVSKNSGVSQFLEEKFPGEGTGCVSLVDIQGAVDPPFFSQEDLKIVVEAITDIAKDPAKARAKAGRLRNLLEEYTWPACGKQAVEALQWSLKKGSFTAKETTQVTTSCFGNYLPIFGVEASASIYPLQIPTRQWHSNSGMAYSQLLRAEEAHVPFDSARQPDLQDISDWLDDSTWPHAVRLITGAGGMGKTRLALELCRHRITASWQAGFLDNDCSPENVTIGWNSLRNQDQPLLIVIDYAETRQPALLALIKAMLKNPGSRPVRILLLARNSGEWWDNLPGQDPYCEALLSGHATSGPFCLPPLYLNIQERIKAYQSALHTFAHTLNVSAPDVVPEMSGEHFGRPLYLQMAALIALHGERPTTTDGLTKVLLNHERRYWRRVLAKANFINPEDRAQRLLALATLTGGFASSSQAKPYWFSASDNSGTAEELDFLFQALTSIYPGKLGLQSVRPDLIGEALVGQALFRPEAEKLLDAVLSKNASQPVRRHALTVITRLAIQRLELHEVLTEALIRCFVQSYLDILNVAIESAGELPLLAETAFNRLPFGVKSQIAGLISPFLLEDSVQLTGLACAVSSFMVEKSGKKIIKNPKNEDLIHHAGFLINNSVALDRAGRDSDALIVAKKALNITTKLYNKNSQRFAPTHAMSLMNYSSQLNDFGKHDEGCIYTAKCLEIYQQLSRKEPDSYESEYAMALSNAAIYLCNIGKYEEGLNHAEKALEIYERLARKNPDRYEPDYARALSNTSGNLSDLGKYEEGLTIAQKALEIYLRLAKNKPDRFEPEYAGALINVANRLHEVGKYKEGLTQSEKALNIHKQLARKRPERYEPNYALSLSNTAIYLKHAGKYNEGITYAKEALEIYERLAKTNPDRFEPDYARSLHNIANNLIDQGKYKDGFIFAERASEIYQRFVTKYPERHEVDSFYCSCTLIFLNWLINSKTNKIGDSSDFPAIPSSAPLHLNPEMLFFRNFGQACCFNDQGARVEKFKSVIIGWMDFKPVEKNQNLCYWLCAAAWCDTFAPNLIEGMNWRENWKGFKEQKNGYIPSWMKATAIILHFDLPH